MVNAIINTINGALPSYGATAQLLLDDYPNAAAAYSLRDLAAAFVGSPVVRVRRSSDNTEQDFTSTEVTDGTLTTFTGANDGFVTTWYDQTGNADVVQATAGSQPQIVIGGTLYNYKGIPAVRFSKLGGFGDNKNLKTASTNLFSQPTSYFVAGRLNLNPLSTQNNLFDGKLNDSNRQTIEKKFNTNNINIFAGNNLTMIGDAALGNFQKLFTSLFNTSNSYGYINGEEKVNGDAGSNEINWGTLGALWRGDNASNNISEFIMYSISQFTNRALIEQNINNYYNLYPDTLTGGFLFNYPNAAAAYSLRDLATYDNGFKPVIVRVRRSSDNETLDFTSLQITDGSLENWVGVGNDGFVEIWYDQTGNENHASQSSTSIQPKIVSNGVLILDNGKPCIDYALGGNDNLILKSRITNVQSVFEIANAEISTGTFSQYLLGDILNLDYASGNFIIDTTFSAAFVRNGNNFLNSILTNFTTNTRPLQQTLYTMIHTSASGIVGQLTRDRAQSGRSWQGKMQEIILYQTDQTANRTGIETNINNYFNIY